MAMRSPAGFFIATICGLALSLPAEATNGYFQHAYGVKGKAMGGASIAVVDGALTTANNPAGMVLVGNRLEIGMDWFQPDRGADLFGQSFNANGDKSFLLPEFGVNYMLRDDLSVGLALFGNGGMNTSFDAPIYSSQWAGSAAGTDTGIDMAQIFLSPTLAYKLGGRHSIGIAFNAVVQYFKATGLANFCAFSPVGFAAGNQIGCPADPAAAIAGLTDQGRDWSSGYGVRVGYLGRWTDWLSVGAYYQTRTRMGRFEKYENLFAEAGDFDIPSHFGAGVSFTPRSATEIAFDVQHIRYASVASVGNLNTGFAAPAAFGLGPALGDPDGPGFGWRNMTVFKFGIEQAVGERFKLRAGASHGRQPVRSSQTAFNVIAPGVIEDHLTFGGAWKLSRHLDAQFFYMHGFGKRVDGTSPTDPFDAGHGTLHMNQDSFGLTFGWNF